MAATAFEKQGNQLTVKPSGRLDTMMSPILDKELKQNLDGVQNVIMDFEKVDYISSSGLRILLTTEQEMESRGGSMRVIHVSEHIAEIFDMIGFSEMIHAERG